MTRRGDSGADEGRLRLATPTAEPGPWERGAHQIETGPGVSAVVAVPDTAPSEPLPVLVFLHGAGGDGKQSLDLVGAEATRRGVVLIAPTAVAHTWDLLAGGLGPDVDALRVALDAVIGDRPVDRNHLGIGGFSDGASYALSLGLANGDVFSHVIAFSPGFAAPPAQIGEPSIFVSHGRADRVLDIGATSRTLVPRLQAAGYDVVYEEFDGGHGVPPAIVERGFEHFTPS